MSDIYTEYDYLAHYGVKGMKWGVRKDRWNENYTQQQRDRDRRIYGGSGVRRINRTMNRYGASISGARSDESRRINNTRKAANVAGKTGSIAGFVGGLLLSDTVLAKRIPNYSDPTVGWFVRSAVASVTSSIARYGAQSATMILGGYAPNRYR